MDRGFVTSNDPTTGREIYGRQRIAPDTGTFSASPWSYNGKIFAISEDGETFVMQAGPQFKLLGRNPLNEMTLATPADRQRQPVHSHRDEALSHHAQIEIEDAEALGIKRPSF